MFSLKKKNPPHGAAAWLATVCMGLLVLTALFELIHTAALGAISPVLTVAGIEMAVLLIARIAQTGHQPWWMAIPCAGCIVLFFYMNNWATTLYHVSLLVTAGICGIWAIVGCVFLLRKKDALAVFPKRPAYVLLTLVLCWGLIWGGNVYADKHRSGSASPTLWAVPMQWDTMDASAQGTIEEIFYETRAYATDERKVTKSALVYLPAGYDPSKQYNILYLLHGTGDDPYYWLRTNPANKIMLDQLIAAGEIEPLIVVTPTFYCEDDCKESTQALEKLTYAFQEELRSDLMPAVESKYATYALTADAAGFEASRHHRAFAGLSRGAVTTYRSVMCGALDYFAVFGAFSGARISADYYQAHTQNDAFGEYSIDYLYIATGNFDFALPQQLMDYQAMLAIEPRLTAGENTTLDIFPMRYHSMGNWHLALYNFLQKIF